VPWRRSSSSSSSRRTLNASTRQEPLTSHRVARRCNVLVVDVRSCRPCLVARRTRGRTTPLSVLSMLLLTRSHRNRDVRAAPFQVARSPLPVARQPVRHEATTCKRTSEPSETSLDVMHGSDDVLRVRNSAVLLVTRCRTRRSSMSCTAFTTVHGPSARRAGAPFDPLSASAASRATLSDPASTSLHIDHDVGPCLAWLSGSHARRRSMSRSTSEEPSETSKELCETSKKLCESSGDVVTHVYRPNPGQRIHRRPISALRRSACV
jgi:hypothetical protein